METLLEVSAVILNLIYLVLLIKEKIACWFFGIAGSLLSIYLFYSMQLYSESILYIYYVVIGVYGYRMWSRSKAKEALKVQNIGIWENIALVILGAVLASALGYFFKHHTDAANPYLDASTTIFSFIASYLEARKIISSWIFWIVINSATLVLYVQQDLSYYLMLTLVYMVFSVIGYRAWRKAMKADESGQLHLAQAEGTVIGG